VLLVGEIWNGAWLFQRKWAVGVSYSLKGRVHKTEFLCG